MAENKKSFIMYCDYLQVFNTLTDKEAGQLIKHILSYVNDEHPAEPENRVLKIAFEPIKAQLKRDLARWDDFKKKQADNGQKGGRPKTQKTQAFSEETQNNPNNPSLSVETQKSLNVTVTDTVTVNGDVITPPPISETPATVIDFFKKIGGDQEQAGRFYRHYEGTKGFENLNNWPELARNWYLKDLDYAKKNQPQSAGW